MTPAEAQLALAALDGLLTAAAFVSDKIAQARKEGLITPAEQADRAAKITEIRAKVGA